MKVEVRYRELFCTSRFSPYEANTMVTEIMQRQELLPLAPMFTFENTHRGEPESAFISPVFRIHNLLLIYPAQL